MARRKVRLADNIARVVELDDAATVGATLGTDVKLNGATATPADVRKWLNVAEIAPATTQRVTLLPGTPASASAPGTPGQVYYDADYLYLCIVSNTWRRIAHSSW